MANSRTGVKAALRSRNIRQNARRNRETIAKLRPSMIETKAVGTQPDIASQPRGSLHQPPLVSVVIPAYNAASYITATLDSAFAQTLSDYEIIVVNDGSPDTPLLEEALQPYLGKIRYIKQENRGPSNARNTGIQASRGKYVAFLDSDDLWFPNHLANQIAIFESDPALGLVYANGVQIRDDQPVGVSFDRTPQSLPVNFDSLLREQSTVNTSSAVVAREALLEAGMFDEQFRRCEDYDLWLRLAAAGVRMTFTREIQIAHRPANGLAASGDLMKQALIAVYQKALATQKLTEEQTSVVRAKIANISLAIQFERAKQFLLEGKFAEAVECTDRAKEITPLWKLRLAKLGLRLFPHVLQSLYRAHLRRVENRKRAQREESLKLAGFANRTIDDVARTGSAAVSAAVRRASRPPREGAMPPG